jgi:carnitine 3-dehydrogenase
MSYSKQVRRVAVVGTGLIGSGWAAHFLARGFDVVATDPAPGAQAALRKFVDGAWGMLSRVGLAEGASRDRLSFEPDLHRAVHDADFVQESGPERPDFKAKLFAEIDSATPTDSLIASSSSAITMDVIQALCAHPERCVIGHPFNPPHVVPLVEVVGGAKTSQAALDQAMSFYAAIGKKPILLRKALPGHVANRLQAALYREVAYLIQQEVVTVEEADIAVCYGPGLRWGVMGPTLQWHLGGGQGGIHHFAEHLLNGLFARMEALGRPELTPALRQTLIDGALRQAGGRSVEELAAWENDVMNGVLKLRSA